MHKYLSAEGRQLTFTSVMAVLILASVIGNQRKIQEVKMKCIQACCTSSVSQATSITILFSTSMWSVVSEYLIHHLPTEGKLL